LQVKSYREPANGQNEGYTGWADWRSVQLGIEWNRKYMPEDENISKP